MDDLSARMRAAADSPPPTRIDVDALINTELRRRTFRWAGAAAGIAAGVALAVAVPAVYLSAPSTDGGFEPGAAPAGSGAAGASPSLCAPLSPSPTGPQPALQSHDTVRDRPTEPVADAVARLTEAARAVLDDVVPDGMTVEGVQSGCAAPQFQHQPSYRDYTLGARVQDQQGNGWLSIRVLPAGASDEPFSCAVVGGDDCVNTEEPDGTRIVATTVHPGRDAGIQHTVHVIRPDGVTVVVTHSNVQIAIDFKSTITRPEPPLTREQLIPIGRAPGLTLYP
jgi:hypothetical protein